MAGAFANYQLQTQSSFYNAGAKRSLLNMNTHINELIKWEIISRSLIKQLYSIWITVFR